MGICVNCTKAKSEHHGYALWCTPSNDSSNLDLYKEALPCESSQAVTGPGATIIGTMEEEDRLARLQRLQQAKTELEQAEVVDPEVMMKEIENERKHLGMLPDETFSKVLGQPDPLPHLQLMNVRLCDMLAAQIENFKQAKTEQYGIGYKNGKDDGRLKGLRDGGAGKWSLLLYGMSLSSLLAFSIGSIFGHYLIH